MENILDRLKARIGHRPRRIAANPYDSRGGAVRAHPVDADCWILQADDEDIALVRGDETVAALLATLSADRLEIAIGPDTTIAGRQASDLVGAIDMHLSSPAVSLVSKHSRVLKRQVEIKAAISATTTAHGRLAAAARLAGRDVQRRIDILAKGART